MKKPIKIRISTGSLLPGHVFRGVGVYSRLLSEALSQLDEIELVAENDKRDITHYPFFDLFFATLPFNCFRKSVVTIHDTIPLIFPEFYTPGVRGRLNLIRQKIALKFVRAVITDSNSSKFDICSYLGVRESRVHVIPLAVDPGYLPQTAEYVKKIRRQLKVPATYILYVGDINYNKNLPALIKTLKFLPNQVQLVCIGKSFVAQPIPEWQAIETQIALSGVEKRVRFVTDVASDQVQTMAALYSGALAYVQPSLYEGFGLPVLEAIKSGCPVVSSNTSSLPEILGESGIQVEPTTEGLLSGIETILAMSDSQRQTLIAAQNKQAKKFSLQKLAQDTLAVYETL